MSWRDGMNTTERRKIEHDLLFWSLLAATAARDEQRVTELIAQASRDDLGRVLRDVCHFAADQEVTETYWKWRGLDVLDAQDAARKDAARRWERLAGEYSLMLLTGINTGAVGDEDDPL